MTILLVIVLFVLLIFPHELGHFIAAKSCGVQVNEFAFGMGPAILKKQGKETLYSIRLFPIGGFCAMEGEDTQEASDNSRAFHNKKWWQKIIILVAGAAMNVVIAVIALTVVVAVTGVATNVIDKVAPESPAEAAGIEAGNEIIAVAGNETDSWEDVIRYLSPEIEDGSNVTILIKTDNGEREMTLSPVQADDERYVIGVEAAISHSPIKVIPAGISSTYRLTVGLFNSMRQIFSSGDVLNQVSGPVGIIKIVGETSQYGFLFYIYLVALISINLAILNLLPLPALDGGRIIFVIIRAVTGKAISDKVESRVHAVGMALLILLAIIVTANDILRIFR